MDEVLNKEENTTDEVLNKEEKATEVFDLASAYEKTFKRISEGDIINGKVIAIGKKDVYIDFGYKSEGIISISEFKDLPEFKIGDEFEVFIESKEKTSLSLWV